jgi:hypothetical protein
VLEHGISDFLCRDLDIGVGILAEMLQSLVPADSLYDIAVNKFLLYAGKTILFHKFDDSISVEFREDLFGFICGCIEIFSYFIE